MTYATPQQLVNAGGGPARFLALTDWDNDGIADATVIADAQTAAEAWIDTYLPVRFSPPIANPSGELQELAAAETIYRIRTRREMVAQIEVDARKERERYLEAIRSGRVRPDALTAVKSGPVRGAVVHLEGRKRLKGLW